MKTVPGLQEQSATRYIKHIATLLALAAALAQFARFLFISLSRIAFPFSLEWMEGGSFVQVSRILAGQPLYIRPSFDFIPQIYPPVYFYVSALISKILGNSFLSLRLVSIASTIGTLFLIYSLVNKQSGSKLGGILASGFYCATFELSGYWFDLARVDSLALAFMLLSALFILKDNPIASIWGGIFLALSIFTKQTMLVMAGVFIIYGVLPPRKNTLLFIGTASFGFIGGTLLMDWLHEGWYSYYVFHLPSQHRVILNIITIITSAKEILFVDILKPILIASTTGLAYLILYPPQMFLHGDSGQARKDGFQEGWSRRAVWLLLLVAGLLAIASVWFLASLPSDAERSILGPYSLARLLLMAGPVFTVILVVAIAFKMTREAAWVAKISTLLFGDSRTVPRFLLGSVILASILIILIAYIRPAFFDGISSAHLQRLSPYLLGSTVFLTAIMVFWRLAWPSDRIETWFFLLLGLGLIATSWLGRLNPGGYDNVFMPAYAGISILFGLGIGFILEKLVSAQRNILSALMILISGVQLVVMLSPLTSQIPTRADREAGFELVNHIKSCPGNVYVPFHTYLAELAGKDGYAGVVEMGELRGSFGGKVDPLWDEVLFQIQSSLDANTFNAVIQDNQIFRDAMSPGYIETGRVFKDDLVFWPVTGRKIRPEIIYVPADAKNCLLKTE